MKRSRKSALIAIGLLWTSFAWAQDFGTLTGDIPSLADRAALEARVPSGRRAAPPVAVKISSTPEFAGPSPVAAEILRQKTLQARQAKNPKIAGHYIVMFKPSAFPYAAKRASGARRLVAANGATVFDKAQECVPAWADSLINVFEAVGGFSALLTDEDAAKLARRDDVLSVGLESMVTPSSNMNIWNADAINQRGGTLNDGVSSRSGAGVHIYVIDTGINPSHTEFSGANISSTGACFVSPGESGYDAMKGDTSYLVDRYEVSGTVIGHGTLVASVIVGQNLGIARGATVHSVRYTALGNAGAAAVVNCINWVASNFTSPAVANMSFGSINGDSSIDIATQALIDAGVTVVASAGNGNNGTPIDVSGTTPARVADAITVASSGRSGSPYQFYQGSTTSNYGAGVDVVAPGDSIYMAFATSNSSYGTAGGTSFAAPAVAAVAAHYLQGHPSALPEEVRNSIVINATTGILSNIGTNTPNRQLYTGAEWIDDDVAIVSGSGTLVATNAYSNGNYYDQVLLTGSTVTVHADSGQVTRVSWIDESDDIVQAEFSGSGNLKIELENYSGPNLPAKYNQAVYYMKGRAKLTVSGAAANTWVSAFSVGTATSTNSSLFISGMSYDARTDLKSLEFTESRYIAGMGFGNVIFRGSSGLVGIDAGVVQLGVRANLMNIDASSSGVATLKFGDSSVWSQYGCPLITGGNLVQSNGSQIQITHLGFTSLLTNQNIDSMGNTIFASTLSGARLRDASTNTSVALLFTTYSQAPGGTNYSGYTSY